MVGDWRVTGVCYWWVFFFESVAISDVVLPVSVKGHS